MELDTVIIIIPNLTDFGNKTANVFLRMREQKINWSLLKNLTRI